MDFRGNRNDLTYLWNNQTFHLKMDGELLTWFGNSLNFIILIYLILAILNSRCFELSQILIAAFGLFVSVLIHLRNIEGR